MALDNIDKIDAIGIDKSSGEVIMTITDSWDWSDESVHLIALQEKVNAYFGFVENGQIFEEFPKAKGKKIVIDIIGKYSLVESAKQFISKASEVAKQLDIDIRFRYIP